MRTLISLQPDYTANQGYYQIKLPIAMEIMIPADDPVRLLSAFVEGMDLSELYSTYERVRKNQASPRQMLKIMIYASMNHLYSSRDIETTCRRDINYMFLLEGMPAPDHATIARFISLHLSICSKKLFSEVASILYELGEVSGKTIFIDGTKIESRANKYTFMKEQAGEKLIFHVDVNSAFLSWSAVKRLQEDPDAVDLRTIPSAVGGDVKTRHGVITAKSIPAKKYGVQTGEPVVKALQKCPQLVLIPSDFATYRKFSKAFIAVLHKYAPVVEQVSIDEAFLDMTGTEEPEAAAKAIRDEIRDTLGFTVNVGISTNRLLAKMASDFSKPDRTHTLYQYEVREKMWPLPIRDLYGCGRRTAEKLNSLGIRTIGDAACADVAFLQSVLGEKAGSYIYRSANGRGSDLVTDEEEKAKSYSNETTTSEDITEENYQRTLPPILHRLSEKVAGRMQRDHVLAQTVFVSAKTEEFQRYSRQMRLLAAENRAEKIEEAAGRLLEQLLLAGTEGEPGLLRQGHRVRLIGVGGSNFTDGRYEQVSLFDWAEEQEKKELERREAEEQERAAAELEEQKRREAETQECEAADREMRAAAARQEQQHREAEAAEAAQEKKLHLEKMLSETNRRFGENTLRRGMGKSD